MRKKDVCHSQPAVNRSLCVAEEYMLGETDFECWGRLWKASPSDPDVDAEEWFTFSEGIEKHCRTNYKNFPDEFYFWDEFSGDRTLDLKIAKLSVLTTGLLVDLQKYLQTHGNKVWRIRIPIYFKPNDRHRVIVIYSGTIDIPPLCNRCRNSIFRDTKRFGGSLDPTL
jgi:hypothetical protein